MRIAPWYLAALAPFAGVGYGGVHLGHAFIVALAAGIFIGTLSLGRAARATETSSAERR